MNSQEPLPQNNLKPYPCKKQGHEVLLCNRICLNKNCLPEWICAECVLQFHLEHVKECVSVDYMQKRCENVNQQWDSHYKQDIKQLEDKSIWMHNRLNSFIQNSQQNISNSQKDIDDLFKNLIDGNIGEISSQQLIVLKDYLNGKKVKENDQTHQFKQISSSVSLNLDKIISILKIFEDSLVQNKIRSTSNHKRQEKGVEDDKIENVQLICQINRDELKNKYKKKRMPTTKGNRGNRGGRRILRSNSATDTKTQKESLKRRSKRKSQDYKETIELPLDLLDYDRIIKKKIRQ